MRPQRMTMSPAGHAPDAPMLELVVTDKIGLVVDTVGVAPVPEANDTIDLIDEASRPPRMTMSERSLA